MLEIASLIVINLVIAGIIGFVLGYIVGRNSFPKIESIENDRVDDSRDDRIKSTLNPIFRKNSNLDYKPLILTTPRPTGKDSLIKIRGINSKIEKAKKGDQAAFTFLLDYYWGLLKNNIYRLPEQRNNFKSLIVNEFNEKVKEEDLVVLPGDFSWATYIEDTIPDFEYLNSLPGNKIMLKGNHDYWWTTVTSMRKFLKENNFQNIDFLILLIHLQVVNLFY